MECFTQCPLYLRNKLCFARFTGKAGKNIQRVLMAETNNYRNYFRVLDNLKKVRILRRIGKIQKAQYKDVYYKADVTVLFYFKKKQHLKCISIEG